MRVLRHIRLSWLLAVLTALSLGLGAGAAQAQFDDEFDDEFDEPAPEPTPEPTPEPEPEDDFDEGFDDDFESDLEDAGNEGELDDETPPSEDDEEEEDDEEAPDADEVEFGNRFRAHNSYLGAVGGLHVVDAASGAVGSFRVQLATQFFFASDFINEGDSADHVGGSLSLSWTPHEMVEIWASLQSYANANDTGDPTLFQVLGDAHLGLKVFHRLNPILAIGGDLDLALLNTVGDIGLVFKSTSVGIRANVTADLRGLDNPVPFIGRFNLQYYFDNSSNLISGTEQARYDNLPDPNPVFGNESRNLLTDVERFALNINRTDFLNLALGFEVPLRAAEDFYIQPLLEWVWNIPVNRQGYNCLFIPGPDGGSEPAPGEDGCLDVQGIGSFPMNLTLGVRVLPPVQGLSVLLAADIGLTGKSQSNFVRELAPNAPYNLYLGMSYAYDTRPAPDPEPEVREVERRVEVQLPPPLMGRIRGLILEQGAGTPVAGGTVRFSGRDLTAQVAGDDGRFTTYALEPGEVTMELSHPDYNPGTCAATIPDERPEEGEFIVEVQCELVALPRVGSVRGTVSSADGGAVGGAQVQLSGPSSQTATTGPDGAFNVQNLPPGTYNVRVDAENFLLKTDTLEVVAREEVGANITLIPRPARALVRVRARDIQIRRQINFATNSADILPSSEPLMTEIADVLLRNLDLTEIEIQGHTDNTGRSARNMTLSENRANSVRTWLIGHGVEASRLQARGFGDTNPLVPNITPSNRARNRRVQFIIKTRVETSE